MFDSGDKHHTAPSNTAGLSATGVVGVSSVTSTGVDTSVKVSKVGVVTSTNMEYIPKVPKMSLQVTTLKSVKKKKDLKYIITRMKLIRTYTVVGENISIMKTTY